MQDYIFCMWILVDYCIYLCIVLSRLHFWKTSVIFGDPLNQLEPVKYQLLYEFKLILQSYDQIQSSCIQPVPSAPF